MNLNKQNTMQATPHLYLFNYEDPADNRFQELYPLVETFARDGIYQDTFVHLISLESQ